MEKNASFEEETLNGFSAGEPTWADVEDGKTSPGAMDEEKGDVRRAAHGEVLRQPQAVRLSREEGERAVIHGRGIDSGSLPLRQQVKMPNPYEYLRLC